MQIQFTDNKSQPLSKYNPHLTAFTSLLVAIFATLVNLPSCTVLPVAKPTLGYLTLFVYLSVLCIVFQEATQHKNPFGDLAQSDLPTGVTQVIATTRTRTSGDLDSSPKHRSDSCERQNLMLKKLQNPTLNFYVQSLLSHM